MFLKYKHALITLSDKLKNLQRQSWKFMGAVVIGTLTICFYSENVPRIGPLRALALKFQYEQTEIESLRKEDVSLVKKSIQIPTAIRNGLFTVVVGPRGIGKSVAINSALNKMDGVVSVSVSPGTDQDSILDKVCKKITGLNGSCADNMASMVRVIYWFKMFSDRAPVVILRATKRELSQTPADTTSAARILVDNFGLIVIIDSSENALTDSMCGREMFIHMKPMSSAMLRQMPGAERLFAFLKIRGDDDFVLDVCNGETLFLVNLMAIFDNCITDREREEVVSNFIVKRFYSARSSIHKLRVQFPQMRKIYDDFKTKDAISFETALDVFEGSDKGFPDTKGVLRRVQLFQTHVQYDNLVPADGAVAILLRLGWDNRQIDMAKIKAAWFESKRNFN